MLSAYESGEKSYEAGDYSAAARSYETCLAADPSGNRDRILFRAGMAYALAGDSPQNLRRTKIHFQRLTTEFPKSSYAAQAQFILSLETEIDKLRGNLKEQQAKIKLLTEELQRLKAIDMQRRPSRAPE